MLLAITFGVAVFGVVAYFEQKNEIGITDDFKDVDLANIIAFAERANAAYLHALRSAMASTTKNPILKK